MLSMPSSKTYSPGSSIIIDIVLVSGMGNRELTGGYQKMLVLSDVVLVIT